MRISVMPITALLLGLAACASSGAAPAPGQALDHGHPRVVAADPTLARGGRLFDDWAKELGAEFVPDDPATEALDGRGGPFGNGTLPDAHGAPMPNTGHDYRLVRLLGPDLRGSEGVFGHCAAVHAPVLVPPLLADVDPRERWRARLERGEDGIPAYGSVLDAAALDQLVGFLLGVRDGALPSPAELFTQSPDTPCTYALVGGGDAARGRALYAERCADCHGAQGTAFALAGGKHSVGSRLRREAPSAWHVILSGKPGTAMGPLLTGDMPKSVALSELRALLAAATDASAFPDLPSGAP